MSSENEISMKTLLDKINDLNNELKTCKSEITKLKNTQKVMNDVLDSHYNYFSTLFMDYKLKPQGILNNMQILSQELLNFVANICNKHDLNWWLIGGNLIGAIRHGTYIPWDDDMDVGMMRKDFHKFNKIAQDEIEDNNMDQYITLKVYPLTRKNWVMPFTKLDCITPQEDIIAGIDIFPYDYARDNKFTLKEFLEFRNEYFIRLATGDDICSLMKDYYNKFNLDWNDGEYIIPNPTFVIFSKGYLKEPIFMKKEKIMPFSKIKFNEKYYNCPNDTDYFLSKEYGDYMNIPKILQDLHGNVDKLRQVKNIDEEYRNFINKLKECNDNFKA